MAAILLFGYRIVPALFLGAFVTNFKTLDNLFLPSGIALGNTLEAVVGFYLIKLFYKKKYFKHYTESLSFLVGGAVSCLVSSIMGVGFLTLEKLILPNEIFYTFITWWGGDFVGVLVFAPFILSLFESEEWILFKKIKTWCEIFVYVFLITAISFQVFTLKWQIGMYWLLSGILIVTLHRLNALIARFLLVISALVATYFTLKGFGPFEFGSANLNLLYLQLVILVFAFILHFMKSFKMESPGLIIFMTFFVGLCLICMSVNELAIEENKYKENQFENLLTTLKNRLLQSEEHYSMLLKGAAGLISLNPQISNLEWNHYTSYFDLLNNYGAINGFGNVKYVENQSLQSYLSSKKKEGLLDFNFRNLDQKYLSQFNSHYIINAIEPLEKNKPARGLNLGSEEHRRTAADLAKSLNRVVATKPIQLVQDKVKRPGFLIYYPVWTSILEKDTQKNFWGWTYAPVISEIFFSTALEDLIKSLNIQLEIDNERVFVNGNFDETQLKKSKFLWTQEIRLFNLNYNIKLYPTEFFFNNRKTFPVLVGVFLSLLLILIIAMLSNLESFASSLAKEVKARTDELLKERLKSLQSSKLASLGEMSAGIAHEINNPLAIISGTLDILPKVANDPEKLRDKIDKLAKSCERIKKIISGLNKFSRSSETVEYGYYDLKQMLNESMTLLEGKINKNNVVCTLDLKNYSLIYCNEIEIEQVFVNLLSNAIDAIKLLPEKWIKIFSFETDKEIIVQVIDSGSGISAQIRERIFDPFYTTKNVGEGTGLGLSVTKGILDMHQASISVVEDNPNTCFEIRFLKVKDKSVFFKTQGDRNRFK